MCLQIADHKLADKLNLMRVEAWLLLSYLRPCLHWH